MNKHPIINRLAGVVFITLTALAACGGGADPVVDACERLDECNALNAGVSVSECIEEVDRARDSFTESERNDWDRLMEGCLGFDGCGTFLDCVSSNGL